MWSVLGLRVKNVSLLAGAMGEGIIQWVVDWRIFFSPRSTMMQASHLSHFLMISPSPPAPRLHIFGLHNYGQLYSLRVPAKIHQECPFVLPIDLECRCSECKWFILATFSPFKLWSSTFWMIQVLKKCSIHILRLFSKDHHESDPCTCAFGWQQYATMLNANFLKFTCWSSIAGQIDFTKQFNVQGK